MNSLSPMSLMAPFCVPLFALWADCSARAEDMPPLEVFWRTTVYAGGRDGCHTYRIPSLLVAPSGALLAFCEGRRDSGRDNGDIDTLVKRSEDGGRTWSAARVVWDAGADTCGNPTAVVDRDTGRIWLFMCHNLAADDGPSIRAGSSAGPEGRRGARGRRGGPFAPRAHRP